MMTTGLIESPASSPDPGFPIDEVERRLRTELEKVARDADVTRPEWEPLLNSQRVVSTIVVLEDLFPFRLPPDRVVKRGGYGSVEEAIRDVVSRITDVASRAQKKKEGK